jgi:hypothetical protein
MQKVSYLLLEMALSLRISNQQQQKKNKNASQRASKSLNVK